MAWSLTALLAMLENVKSYRASNPIQYDHAMHMPSQKATATAP